MFLVALGFLCMISGLLLYFVGVIFSPGRLIILDCCVFALLLIPWIVTLYRIKTTRCWYQVDRIPVWKHLIKYLRRDNEVIELLGERAYPGESFIDVPMLGLFEFLGKDTVFHQGDKNFVWGLENINFTPDPRYFNFTHLLWELGFSDSDDIRNVLQGNDLELMGKVYLKMENYDNGHGVQRLVTELQEYDKDVVVFKPMKETSHKNITDIIDKIKR